MSVEFSSRLYLGVPVQASDLFTIVDEGRQCANGHKGADSHMYCPLCGGGLAFSHRMAPTTVYYDYAHGLGLNMNFLWSAGDDIFGRKTPLHTPRPIFVTELDSSSDSQEPNAFGFEVLSTLRQRRNAPDLISLEESRLVDLMRSLRGIAKMLRLPKTDPLLYLQTFVS